MVPPPSNDGEPARPPPAISLAVDMALGESPTMTQSTEATPQPHGCGRLGINSAPSRLCSTGVSRTGRSGAEYVSETADPTIVSSAPRSTPAGSHSVAGRPAVTAATRVLSFSPSRLTPIRSSPIAKRTAGPASHPAAATPGRT